MRLRQWSSGRSNNTFSACVVAAAAAGGAVCEDHRPVGVRRGRGLAACEKGLFVERTFWSEINGFSGTSYVLAGIFTRSGGRTTKLDPISSGSSSQRVASAATGGR